MFCATDIQKATNTLSHDKHSPITVMAFSIPIVFKKTGTAAIFQHETTCCNKLLSMLQTMPQVTVYRQPGAAYAPIVSFNIQNLSSEETAELLDQKGFCLRAGLHCAPLAHRAIGTIDGGTVRFAPSIFNTLPEVVALGNAIRNL